MLPSPLQAKGTPLSTEECAVRATRRELDAIDGCVTVVDASLSVVYSNAAIDDALPLSRAGADLRQVAPEIARLLITGGLSPDRARILTVGRCQIRVSATSVHNERGEWMGAALEWEDVTEEVELDRIIAVALAEPRSSDRLGLRAAIGQAVASSRGAAAAVFDLLGTPARRRAAAAALN